VAWDTPPHLIIEVEHVPGFARGRERSSEYPAFRRTLPALRTIAVSRFDAEGQIRLPGSRASMTQASQTGQPVHARFRVGDSTNSRHVLAYVAEPDTAAHVLSVAARITAATPAYRLELRQDHEVAAVVGVT
jgi:hypothetical protein